MRYFVGATADLIWQDAAKELIEHPDYAHNGRNGKTKEILPCVLRIKDPRQRWILSRQPPYNPAFGLVEFIWIVTGNNESRVLNYWNPGLPKYSGDGPAFHGAYGFRLRHEFGLDQIERAYDILHSAPETRQAILQIWKPEIDTPTNDGRPVSADIPCNIMSLLKVRDGRLHWSQIMRSNDIMRGLPYNIIQFTMLQEVMAGWLDCKLGEYFHLSDSLHMYQHDADRFFVHPTESSLTDRKLFSLSYDESQELFLEIYELLAMVARGKLDQCQLMRIFDREKYWNRTHCELIADIMVVIGSDAARRYGLSELAFEMVDSCADVSLRTAATAWLKHKEREHERQQKK